MGSGKGYFDAVLRDFKRFVTSRDLFVFLFFLVLSTIFWGLQALSARYETVVRVPVVYEDLPEGFCKSEGLTDTLRVTVADKGTALVRYHMKMLGSKFGNGFDAIKVEQKLMREGRNTIQTRSFSRQISAMLNSSTEIVSIKPDTIRVMISKIESKHVRVVLDANIGLSPQYILKDIAIEPQKIEVYGTKEMLEKVDSVLTVSADAMLQNVDGNRTVEVPLRGGRDISLGQGSVTVKVSAEQFTEKELAVVAVSTANVPQGMTLRTFPSSVSVNCKIGVSGWEKIVPSSFTIIADYEDIVEGANKLQVKVGKMPEGAFDVRITPSEVEYLVETK